MPASMYLGDKDIDRALALLFLVLCGVSAYSACLASENFIRLQALASIPINLAAALSFLVRSPPKGPTYVREMVVPSASFTFPTAVLYASILTPPQYAEPILGLIAIPGAILSVVGLLYLRRSFAILPSVRNIVTSGPYSMVRHPVYLGETLFLFGLMMLRFNLLALALLAGAMILLVIRIGIEEKKLGEESEYRAYMNRVRYRLIPHIY